MYRLMAGVGGLFAAKLLTPWVSPLRGLLNPLCGLVEPLVGSNPPSTKCLITSRVWFIDTDTSFNGWGGRIIRSKAAHPLGQSAARSTQSAVRISRTSRRFEPSLNQVFNHQPCLVHRH